MPLCPAHWLASGSAGDMSGDGAGENSVPRLSPPLTYGETLAGEEEEVVGRDGAGAWYGVRWDWLATRGAREY